MKIKRRVVEPPAVTRRIAELERHMGRLEREMAPLKRRYDKLRGEQAVYVVEWYQLVSRWGRVRG